MQQKALRLVPLFLVAALLSGCSSTTICHRESNIAISAPCLEEQLRPGDDIWIYMQTGETYRASYLATERVDNTTVVMIARVAVPTIDRPDTLRLDLEEVRKVSAVRTRSAALFGFFLGVALVGSAVLLIFAGMSMVIT